MNLKRPARSIGHFDYYVISMNINIHYTINVNLVNQTPIYVGYDVIVEMPYSTNDAFVCRFLDSAYNCLKF